MAYGTYDTQYDDLTTRIKNNANSYTAPTYQNGSNMVGQITSDLVRQQDPIRKAETDRINTQANQSRSALQEYLANKGQRGGQATARLVGLQQGRNTDLANMNANYTSAAMNQAPTYANLSLNERSQIQGQQNTAANQLASLLGQRISNDQSQAQLSGVMSNGQQTLSAQQLAAQIAQNQASNALQQSSLSGYLPNGQQTLSAQAQTSDIANQQFNQRLALLQALQNYNLGVGQISDTLPQVSGYNYGDAMKQALSGLLGNSGTTTAAAATTPSTTLTSTPATTTSNSTSLPWGTGATPTIFSANKKDVWTAYPELSSIAATANTSGFNSLSAAQQAQLIQAINAGYISPRYSWSDGWTATG